MILNNLTFCIIGSGNMGSALINGLIASGHSPERIIACDADRNKLDQLQKSLKIDVNTDNLSAVQQADIVILAVKPQIIKAVVEPLAAIIINRKPLVISIAAGITLDLLQQWLSNDTPIVRAMPNTAAQIQQSMTVLFGNQVVSGEQNTQVTQLFSTIGKARFLATEDEMNAATAIAGSGPAYFYLVMEAMIEAGQAIGLPKDIATKLTLQTALGATNMVKQTLAETPLSIQDLREQVTSPGGTTAAALKVLDQGKLRELFDQAIKAAEQRAQELAKSE